MDLHGPLYTRSARQHDHAERPHLDEVTARQWHSCTLTMEWRDSRLLSRRVRLTSSAANCAHHRPVRLSWARLLNRVFELDLEPCSNCGGELKIIAAILEAPVIEKILTHRGLQARAPPRAVARGPHLQAA